MFNNVNWNKIINNVLSYIKKDWKYLIIKVSISQTTYTAKFYYSTKNNEFIDLYKIINDEKRSTINDITMSELKIIPKNFNDPKEKMFITIKTENTGNVKVIYRDIKDGDKLPFDEEHEYIKLNEKDKII